MGLVYPERIALAQLPTPVRPSQKLAAALGVELMFKRDDLTGATLTGNKVRKLEFLMAEALASGADMVVTCGESSPIIVGPPLSPRRSWAFVRSCCCEPTIRRSRRRPKRTSFSIVS